MSIHSLLRPDFVCLILLAIFMMVCNPKQDETGLRISVIEMTIKDIHEAYRSGTLTCQELVEIYSDRIEKYDKSTKLNTIVVVNPDALETAKELDLEFQKTGKLRLLHGVPVIVKDNMRRMICRPQVARWRLKDLSHRTMPIRFESFGKQEASSKSPDKKK